MQSTMLSSSSQKLETYDELDVKNKAELRNLLDVDERVLFSGMLAKINKHASSQERMLIITNKHLYNVQPDENLLSKITFFIAPQSSVKRKIPIKQVWGVTISSSNLSDQLVIHIDNDYDYRYDCKGKQEKVLRSICNAYFRYVNQQLPLYISEESDLFIFQTTDDDFKAKIDKKPKEGRIFLTREILDKGLTWIIANRSDLRMQAKMQSSVSGSQRVDTSVLQRSNSHVVQTQSTQFQPVRQTSNQFVPRTTLSNNQPNLPPNQGYSAANFGAQQTNSVAGFQRQQTSPAFLQNNAANGGVGVNYQQQQNVPYNPQPYVPPVQNNQTNQAQNVSAPISQPVSGYGTLADFIKADLGPINSNVNVNFSLGAGYETQPNNNAQVSNQGYGLNAFGRNDDRSRKNMPY